MVPASQFPEQEGDTLVDGSEERQVPGVLECGFNDELELVLQAGKLLQEKVEF